ncbi:uncharacterized protein LOC127773458 [Oryza glaberrima]|uniref:uncharacterized protein LOC127773458 n=1 Tax=Oryza glaberrima TaxID=4538 RepID=UPI00224C4057|nr:uncharacterized protein LOC127773458 [Oryza glaberrima]
MAAALRFAARKVSRGALQQATAFVSPSPAVKEEQRRLLPEHQTIASQPHAKPVADVDLSRVPESIRPQFESWYRRHYAHTRFVNAESSAPNSCKEPASLGAQIEEKKHELFHLLFELKYGRKSIAGGEKLSIQDERIRHTVSLRQWLISMD